MLKITASIKQNLMYHGTWSSEGRLDIQSSSFSWTAYDGNLKFNTNRYAKETTHPENTVLLQPMWGDGGNVKNNYQVENFTRKAVCGPLWRTGKKLRILSCQAITHLSLKFSKVKEGERGCLPFKVILHSYKHGKTK